MYNISKNEEGVEQDHCSNLLNEEIEEWTTEIARLKKLKSEHMNKRAMKDEGEPSNKKIKGNIE